MYHDGLGQQNGCEKGNTGDGKNGEEFIQNIHK